MSREKIPLTPALLALKKNQVVFVPRTYKYVEHGGTRVGAKGAGG